MGASALRARGLIVLGLSGGCSADTAPRAVQVPTRDVCEARGDITLCDAERAVTCQGEKTQSVILCSARDQVCQHGVGCVHCIPGAYTCEGNRLLRCDAAGLESTFERECDEGLVCSVLGCRDLCADAVAQRSYIGCEYWPTFLANSRLSSVFRPAVAIGNANQVAADVVIRRGGELAATVRVEPGEAEVVELAYGDPQRTDGSRLTREGAYQLVSSVPVTVHQFNPLRFERPPEQGLCGDPGGEPDAPPIESCFSFSNDASLLLPAHVFERPEGEATTYMALSRASFVLRGDDDTAFSEPGFLAVVATGDRPVHARIRVTAHTQGVVTPSLETGEAPAAGAPLEPGEELEVELAPGDVLSLLSAADAPCADEPVAIQGGYSTCSPPVGHDLTGSEVVADGPVQVVAGHNCTNVPIERPACDHLEETMFPVDTWGRRVVLARPFVKVGRPYLLRVLSSSDDNEVRFDPPVREPARLDRGQWLELSSSEHLMLSADEPISVAQLLTGQGDALDRTGDPAMTVAIPVEQYREEYVFLTPPSYTANYVSVIAQGGDLIELDGRLLTGAAAVGDSHFEVTSVSVGPGTHVIRSRSRLDFGIVLYGVGAYTSYFLPGGLDLNLIAAPL